MLLVATVIAAVAASLTLFLILYAFLTSGRERSTAEPPTDQASQPGRELADVKALEDTIEKLLQRDAERLANIEDMLEELRLQLTRHLKSASLQPPPAAAPPEPEARSAPPPAPAADAAPFDSIAPDRQRSDDRVTTKLPPWAEPPPNAQVPPPPTAPRPGMGQ